MNTLSPTLITDLMNPPTSTVNVLPHLQELREKWRQQDFRFTKEQQEEYDILLQARRERVQYFYDNNLVQIGPKVIKKAEPVQEDLDD
jgi:hypothetical protein